MTAHDPRVTLTEVLAAHVRLPMMHSQGCTCGWHASLSHPDLHRAHLAERLEEHFAGRLAPIRALLVQAEKYDDERLPTCDFYGNRFTTSIRQDDLRAALDAPVSASQDHDGAEGQGKWPHRPRWHVHNHLPYEPTCNERLVDGQLRGACLNDDGSPR